MRLKHNKKRNTAFVYEALIRELTKSIIKNDTNRKNKVSSVIKEHFASSSEIKRELDLYRTLYEADAEDEVVAEKIVVETKIRHSKLNKERIFQEQTSLINKINKLLGVQVFDNFVPSYKNLASIYSIFNNSVGVKSKVILEERVIGSMKNKKMENSSWGEKDPIDNLVYRSFVKKFNQKYNENLNESQKNLLTKYVTSFVDDGLELKIFLNDEIGALKEQLKEHSNRDDIRADEVLLKKTNEVLDLLESYKSKEVSLETVEEILKIQQLNQDMVEFADGS